MNLCTKPNCARPGAVVLAYDYAARKAILEDAAEGQLSPHVYVLCLRCADRLRPPRGWELEDLREKPPLFVDAARDLVAATGGRAAEEPADETPAAASRRQLFFGYS